MIYVYKLPEKLSNGFCNSTPKPITFGNVDWFNSPSEMGEGEQISKPDFIELIAQKNYAQNREPLLVVDTHGDYSMLIKFNSEGAYTD